MEQCFLLETSANSRLSFRHNLLVIKAIANQYYNLSFDVFVQHNGLCFQSVCSSLECTYFANISHLCNNRSKGSLSMWRWSLNIKSSVPVHMLSGSNGEVRAQSRGSRRAGCAHIQGVEPYASLSWFLWYSFHSCLQPQRQLWGLRRYHVGTCLK